MTVRSDRESRAADYRVRSISRGHTSQVVRLDSRDPHSRVIGEVVGEVISLHDVDDVSGLAKRAMDVRLKEWGGRLRDDARDDALAYLVATSFELARNFDASRGLAYSTYAYRMLRLRLADWYRDRFGDTRHGSHVPDLLGEEAIAGIADRNDPVEATLTLVNSARLTPDQRNVLEQIAKPIALEDATIGQVSARLGWSRRRVTRALDHLAHGLAA